MNRRTALSAFTFPLGLLLPTSLLAASPSPAAPPTDEFIKVSKKGARIAPPRRRLEDPARCVDV